MKRRYLRLLMNVCSFGLLALALYLNFIKKESSAGEEIMATAGASTGNGKNAKNQVPAGKNQVVSTTLK